MYLNSYARALRYEFPQSYLDILQELLTYEIMVAEGGKTDPCVGREEKSGRLKSSFQCFHWSRQMEWPWAVAEARAEKHHRVLDIGAGCSPIKYALSTRCSEVVVLDNDKVVRNLEYYAADFRGKIRGVVGDGRSLPFPDCSFDRVLIISVLEHVEGEGGWQKCIHEAMRVLKLNGVLLISMDVLAEGGKDNGKHIRRDAVEEMIAMLGIPPLAATELKAQVKWKDPREEDAAEITVYLFRAVKAAAKWKSLPVIAKVPGELTIDLGVVGP